MNAEKVRNWAAEQYPSDTLLDQDRRMVAAETEAFLSGRSSRDTSDLVYKAQEAGPVLTPSDWRERRIGVMMDALATLPLPVWWGGEKFRKAAIRLVDAQDHL